LDGVIETQGAALLMKLHEEEGSDRELLQLWERREQEQNKLLEKFRAARSARKADVPERKHDDPPDAGQDKPQEEAQRFELMDKRAPELQVLDEQITSRLGCVATVEGNPLPGGGGMEAVRHGPVDRKKLYLSLRVAFWHPEYGLPALAEWLAGQGCIKIRYEIEHNCDDPVAEEDAEP
jgi:hypothetical protein